MEHHPAKRVCFLHSTEGLRLTFSYICSTTGQMTMYTSSSRLLIPSLDSPHHTSTTGRSTDPVGEEDRRIEKEDREDPKTENVSEVKEEKNFSLPNTFGFGAVCCSFAIEVSPLSLFGSLLF